MHCWQKFANLTRPRWQSTACKTARLFTRPTACRAIWKASIGAPGRCRITSRLFPVPVNAQQNAAILYRPVVTVQSGLQKNRFAIVPLKDIAAPYPYLQDAVDESFQALRQEVSRLIGWDFLGNLDNAYLPITTPSCPSFRKTGFTPGAPSRLIPLR